MPVTTEALLEMKINAGFAEDDCQMTESSTNDSANEEKRRFIRQSKKVKRLRRKQHYSKFIKPKNALMSLHELLGTAFLEFNILPEEHGFVASVYVNGVHYEGRGDYYRFSRDFNLFYKCVYIFARSIKNSIQE